MRRVVSVLALLFLVVSAAYPCGGKYLGRNAAKARPAVRPASILILAKHSRANAKLKSMVKILEQSGHKVKAVVDSDEVVTALKSGKKYDIVMANISDMETLAQPLKAASKNVVPVPIISKNSKEDSRKAKQYQCAVKMPSKSKEINKEIGKALKLKEKVQKEITSSQS